MQKELFLECIKVPNVIISIRGWGNSSLGKMLAVQA